MKLHRQLERCVKVPGFLSIRAGMGLGDSIYLQSVARHFIEQGQKVMACSKWPDVFRPLGENVLVAPFTRGGVDRVAHYSMRKSISGTSQFQDCCIQAGIKEPVALRLDWTLTDYELSHRIHRQADGRPIVCVQLPRLPMDRTDGFGKELMPQWAALQAIIDEVWQDCFIVQIGAGIPVHQFSGIELDLANKTSVSQLLDLASIASGFIGYVSFIVPLAESFGKPAVIVWSRRGLSAPQGFVRQIIPQKVLHGKTCQWLMDDEPEKMEDTAQEFIHRIAGKQCDLSTATN